jgi:ATP:corrinoid adenosyltransferase
MAQMIPSVPVDGCADSEKTVFEALKSTLPGEWIVIHSRCFVLPATGKFWKPKECEVDFLILHPKRGFLGLEVKGGQDIGRDHDGWYSIDHYGNRHSIKDPGAQAQNATHTVSNYLKNFAEFSTWQPAYGWGVCFPGVTVNRDLDPGLPKQMVIDNTQLSDMRTHLDRVFEANGMLEGLIPQSKIKAFLNALAPSFKLAPSLASRFDAESPALVQMTDEQNDVLDMFEEFNRVAVKGGAGTGKTFVAMEKARRLSKNGKRVLLLCFNRPLADFLAKRADGFVVETFHRFASQLCKRASIQFKEPSEDNKKDDFWSAEAADLLQQAMEVYPDERYDAVIVDEAQDFKPVWWIPVEGLLKSSSNSTFYIFYDPNQQIYDGGPAEDLGLKSTVLKYNCRNTRNIAEYSCRLVNMDPVLKPGAPVGQAVEILPACKDEKDMVDAVRKTIHRLVTEEKLATDRIAILTTGELKRSPVYRAQKLGNIKIVSIENQPNRDEVCMSSLHRFKGLESDVVILCDVKPNEEDSAPRQLYVATSRARHLLIVAKYEV